MQLDIAMDSGRYIFLNQPLIFSLIFQVTNASFPKALLGVDIHQDAEQLGGISNLQVNPSNFALSDDTVTFLYPAYQIDNAHCDC